MTHLRGARLLLCCRAALCVSLVLSSLSGCGGRATYPVEGKLVVKDGAFPAKDLAGYLITLESASEPVGAYGTVQPDGTFRIGTFKEADGAIPGKHRVAVTPPQAEEGRPRPKKLLHERYQRLETSGLEVVIEPRTNQITLDVEARPR